MSKKEKIPFNHYLIRAIYEWMVANGHRPFIVADGNYFQDHSILSKYIDEIDEIRAIVFNIDPDAVTDLNISEVAVEFTAKFKGVPTQVHIPIRAVKLMHSPDSDGLIPLPPLDDNPLTDDLEVDLDLPMTDNNKDTVVDFNAFRKKRGKA